MKNNTRVLLSLLLGAALFAAAGHSADEKPNPAKAKPSKVMTDVDVESAWQRQIHEVYFDNLPLTEVANFLSQQFPELNFIVPEGARDENVPPLKLRNVTLDEILKAIELASEGRIRGGVPNTGFAINQATGLPLADANARRNLVTFSIGSLPGILPPARMPEKAEVLCRVFSLGPYLAYYRSEKEVDAAIQSLYEALDIAWNMLGKQVRIVNKPELKIHPGTKLLIAVGREQELAVIDQVVKQLQVAAGYYRRPAADNENKNKGATTDAPPTASPKQ